MNKTEDMIGNKYGHLTVLRITGYRTSPCGTKHRMVECLCDCGKVTETYSQSVIHGKIKCCSKKCIYSPSCSRDSHKSVLYGKWKNMKARCNNPKLPTYRYYGAKGISVCEEWQGKYGYIHFKEWAINNGFREDLTLDRIDVHGNYEPSNCRWVPRSIQDNNRSDNRYITYNGETHTVAEWSRITGIEYSCLKNRLDSNWSKEDAFNIVPSHSNAHIHD